MHDVERLRDDLSFVRETIRDAGRDDTPAAIYLIWAVVIVCGFPLYDVAPKLSSIYWPIAAPLGALASFVVAWRHTRRRGQSSRREGARHVLHWGGMMVAIGFAVLLHIRGELTGQGMAATATLIAAFGWYLAGVHLVRSMLWLGLVLAAGFLAVVFIDAFSWTLAGGVIALSLVLAALIEARRGRSASRSR